jgi:hypothetical protein
VPRFSVYLKWRPAGGTVIDPESLARLSRALAPYKGVVTANGVEPEWDARVFVDSDSEAQAVAQASVSIRVVATNVGITPDWEAVRYEVQPVESRRRIWPSFGKHRPAVPNGTPTVWSRRSHS